MTAPKPADPSGIDPLATERLLLELVAAAMEDDQRSLFEQRALLDHALETLQRLRAGSPPDPLFDGKHSSLREVERVRQSIARAEPHQVRAAMMIIAELIHAISPSAHSPLDLALRRYNKKHLGEKSDTKSDR